VREGVDVRPWKVGGTGVSSFSHEQPAAYPTRLEAGTLNGHGIAGLSSALDFVVETGVETIAAHEAALASRFVDQVASIDGVTVYGDVLVPDHGRRTATVSINVRDYDSAAVSDALSQTYDIATRPGAHCAPRMHESMGTTDRGTVRFSFGWFNTGEDADEAAAAVRKIAS
jgi:selenocysteine lyase/cysteine desulfurase